MMTYIFSTITAKLLNVKPIFKYDLTANYSTRDIVLIPTGIQFFPNFNCEKQLKSINRKSNKWYWEGKQKDAENKVSFDFRILIVQYWLIWCSAFSISNLIIRCINCCKYLSMMFYVYWQIFCQDWPALQLQIGFTSNDWEGIMILPDIQKLTVLKRQR